MFEKPLQSTAEMYSATPFEQSRKRRVKDDVSSMEDETIDGFDRTVFVTVTEEGALISPPGWGVCVHFLRGAVATGDALELELELRHATHIVPAGKQRVSSLLLLWSREYTFVTPVEVLMQHCSSESSRLEAHGYCLQPRGGAEPAKIDGFRSDREFVSFTFTQIGPRTSSLTSPLPAGIAVALGMTPAQQAALSRYQPVRSVEELRALPPEQLSQRLRLTLSPDGQIVPLRASYLEQAVACHAARAYDQDWLRFSGGMMHFVAQDLSVLPVTLQPAIELGASRMSARQTMQARRGCEGVV